MKALLILLAVVILLLIAVCLEIRRELRHFRVTYYEAASPKLKESKEGITLVFLSDLHNRSYGVKNSRLIRAIKELRPDLILIGGDMLVGKADADPATALDLVRQLPAIAPVFYAPGNHEARLKDDPAYYGDTYRKYEKDLKDAGVTFLENTSAAVRCKGEQLLLYGLDLPLSTYKKFRKASVTSDTVSECLAKSGTDAGDKYKILLAHNPAYMEAYLEWGADLVLSGHLHGGLVRVPGIGGIVTPQGFFFPKYSGEMTQTGDQTAIVSRGLGTHTMNIRMFNMPELIAVHLKKLL